MPLIAAENIVADHHEPKTLRDLAITWILPMIRVTIFCLGICYFKGTAGTLELSTIHWFMLQLLLAFFLLKRNALESAYSSHLLQSILTIITLLILLGSLEGALKWAFLMILICTFGLLLAAVARVYARLGNVYESNVKSENDDTVTVM